MWSTLRMSRSRRPAVAASRRARLLVRRCYLLQHDVCGSPWCPTKTLRSQARGVAPMTRRLAVDLICHSQDRTFKVVP